MTTNLPAWALIQATPADRLRTKQAYEQGNMQTNWDTAVSTIGPITAIMHSKMVMTVGSEMTSNQICY